VITVEDLPARHRAVVAKLIARCGPHLAGEPVVLAFAGVRGIGTTFLTVVDWFAFLLPFQTVRIFAVTPTQVHVFSGQFWRRHTIRRHLYAVPRAGAIREGRWTRYDIAREKRIEPTRSWMRFLIDAERREH
jgi:hypothetical protein